MLITIPAVNNTVDSSPGVWLMASRGGLGYSNNTELRLSDVFGITSRYSLLCVTERRPCCSDPNASNKAGDWYYQNGTAVPSFDTGLDFYTSRGDDGTVRLHARDNVSLMNTSQFCCEILNINDLSQKLCVNICDSDCEIMSEPVTETTTETQVPAQMSSNSGATIGSVVTTSSVLVCVLIVAVAIVVWKYCSPKAKTTQDL